MKTLGLCAAFVAALLSVGCSGARDAVVPPIVDDGMKEVTLTLHGEDGLTAIYQPCLAFGPPAAPAGSSVAAENIAPISLGRIAIGTPITIRQVFGQQFDAWNGYPQQCQFSGTLHFEATLGQVTAWCITNAGLPQTCTAAIDTTVPAGSQVLP